MANTTCAKCGHTQFELKEIVVKDSAFKLMSVQCASCGTSIGVIDYYNIGHLIKKQSAAIKKIATQLKVSVDL